MTGPEPDKIWKKEENRSKYYMKYQETIVEYGQNKCYPIFRWQS